MKIVVVYVFHEINDNVRYFFQHGVFEDKDINFIFVCNGSHILDLPSYVKYINRSNIGHDFGAWSHAIYTENLIEKYDFFVLLNSSVKGPFIPPWSPEKNWIKLFTQFIDEKVKLVGTTLAVDEYLTHIQSSILVLDKVGLNIGIEENIFELNPIDREKRDIVILKEVGLSQGIMKHGYKIKPLLSSYHNTDISPISSIRSRVHHINQWYYGIDIHPYEVIFCKDKGNSNIKLLTKNHDLHFAQSISPTIPKDFDWKQYLELNPDISHPFTDEVMVKKHWLNFGFYEERRYFS
jgi:hypothetical protein